MRNQMNLVLIAGLSFGNGRIINTNFREALKL